MGGQAQAFVHEAELILREGADERAPGGAVTVALCGHWEHEGPCRWPHNSAIVLDHDRGRLRTVFLAAPEEETLVREQIDQGLGGAGDWTVVSSRSRSLTADEELLGRRLARLP